MRLGRLAHLFKGATMVGAMVVGGMMLCAAPAQAQTCGAQRNGESLSVPGTLIYQGALTRGECTEGLQVHVRMENGGFDCSTGSKVLTPTPSRCVVTNSGSSGNAVSTINGSRCGEDNGYTGGLWQISSQWYTYSGEAEWYGPVYLDSRCDDQCPEGYYWTGTQCYPTSPIVIALGRGQQYKFTSAQDGVWFDLDGDGTPERTAWTEKGSQVAFLAYDRNGDGIINNGTELFGNHTIATAKNGFAALADMAALENGGVHKGNLREDSPLFNKLVLWTDSNHDGISQASEMKPLSDQVSQIGLDYNPSGRKDGHGNMFMWSGWARVRTAPGLNQPTTDAENQERNRIIYDVGLVSLR